MKNKILEEIGFRLKQARNDKGYTQEELANLTGLSIKMLSAAENGHKAMRPENIIKICAVSYTHLWVEQIGGNAGRECNAPRHHVDVLRIGGIIPHANVVHQPSDDGGISGDSLPGRNPLDVVVQQSDEFAVIRGHHRKTCNGLPKLCLLYTSGD